MSSLRSKLIGVLTIALVFALWMMASGVMESRDFLNLWHGGAVPWPDEGACSPHASSDAEQPLRKGAADDSPLNVQSDEIVQKAYPPERQKPRLTPGDLLEVMELNDKFISLSKANISVSSAMLGVWPYWSPILDRAEFLPQSMNAMEEGLPLWIEATKSLLDDVKQEKKKAAEASAPSADDAVKQCPYSVSALNTTELSREEFVLDIPCGLVVDSSITVVGIPRGLLGDFRINLLGERLPGEKATIILHYNVRLHGDLSTNTSVIVHNSWTPAKDWEEEVRCPAPEGKEDNRTVDGLSKCIGQVGQPIAERRAGEGRWPAGAKRGMKERVWFPFVEGFPFAATLRVGLEGFHMTVNGKHITSYAYKQNLEPWLVSGVEVKGDIQTTSLMVNGLPYVEDLDRIFDLEFLKASPLPVNSNLTMLIGVFSTSNNFDRRMAIRRSWMQAKEVKSGKVAVRFFVGLHKTKQVNKELLIEASTYGDVQLMPFVDYYDLITLKTLAVCIIGTKVLHADFIMKTDDDTFVRVDEVLSSVISSKTQKSILYGRMEFEATPHRTKDDKWFVSEEEFPDAVYPPWAHGPGYIISQDIASYVVHSHQRGELQIFKLEDVAMGIWIQQFQNRTRSEVDFINNDNFMHGGCADGYIIAHYRSPRQMLCMSERWLHGTPSCC